jgi:hypothetical protein
MPLIVIVPVLLSPTAVTVVVALRLPLPITTELLLLSVPPIESVVPPCPPPVSTSRSPPLVRPPPTVSVWPGSFTANVALESLMAMELTGIGTPSVTV